MDWPESRSKDGMHDWIPACAGMTIVQSIDCPFRLPTPELPP
jgi:hypothetical protein